MDRHLEFLLHTKVFYEETRGMEHKMDRHISARVIVSSLLLYQVVRNIKWIETKLNLYKTTN